MFFRKRQTDSGVAAAATPVGATTAARDTTALPGDLRASAPESTMLLDTLGAVVSGIAHHPINLPHRPAEQSTRELMAWHRHAMLGVPTHTEDESQSVGIGDRDWAGLVRAVTDLQRDAQGSVENLVAELRGALWTCVSAVHEAVQIDDFADARTGSHLARVKRAVNGSQMGSLKEEVLSAITEIDRLLRERREEQQRQYRTLASSLDSLGRQLEEAKKESATDPLTGIGNRKHFDLMARRAIQMFSLGRSPVTLLMIDLNKLKIINDSYGHTTGDAAIVTLAQALKLVFLRQSDVVCRYGGDEFAVILNNCDTVVAQTLTKRLLEQIRALPSPSLAMEFALGASIGIAQLEAGEDVVQWVERADQAMYQAKQQAVAGVMIASASGGMAAATQRRSA